MNDRPRADLAKDSVFKRWGEFVRRNRTILISMLGYAAIPAVVNFIFAVGPPWPKRAGVSGFTSVVGYLAAIISYVNYAHGARTSEKMRVVRKAIRRLSRITAVSLVVYVFLSACFVYDAPDAAHQVAGGFILRPDVAELIRTRPGMTEREALESKEWNPEGVWLHWTVSVMDAALLLTWLSFFGCLGALISGFVVYLETENAIQRQTRASPSADSRTSGKGD